MSLRGLEALETAFKPSDQTTETFEDRSCVGQVICLWTYEAEPAPPGKASFGEFSVSNMDIVIKI